MSENRPLALVTGASHGIGAELARVFAGHGHDLIVVAEDAAIGEVAERMRRHGGSAHAVQTDLSDPKGVEEVDQAIVAAGRPLVAAALNARAASPGASWAACRRTDPGKVARQGYDALMAGRTAVVGGSPLVQAQAAVAGVLPDQVKAVAHRLIARPRG